MVLGGQGTFDVAGGAKPAEEKFASESGSPCMKILLAEDEELVRKLASRAIQAAGYEVLEAGNGDEALAALREHGAAIAAIVTDVVMPGMYGPEFVRAAEDEGIGAWPVLFMSAFLSHPSRAPTELPPGADFLPKPFTGSQLVAELEKVVVAAGLEPPQGKVLSFPNS